MRLKLALHLQLVRLELPALKLASMPQGDQHSGLLEPVLGLLPKHLLCGYGHLRQCQQRLINQRHARQLGDEQAVLRKRRHLLLRFLLNLRQQVLETMGQQ